MGRITANDIKTCGTALFQAFITRTPMDRPSLLYGDALDFDVAYDIQKEFVRQIVEKGRSVSGKKVGLTSKAMRDLVNINEPDYGTIFFEDAYENESDINLDDFILPRVECEIMFRLKKGLDKKNINEKDVLDSISYFVPAFEIIDNRYKIDGQVITDSIADNAAFGAYVLGDKASCIKEIDDLRNIGTNLYRNGKCISGSTTSAVMGNPINAVVWLANKLNGLGDPLLAGDFVLSGSIIAAVPMEKGDYYTADYGRLGKVSFFCK